MMSGRFRRALNKVPATKPICTDSVNQLAALSLRFHSLVKAGTTAEPLNQSDIPSNSAKASRARVRQRDLNCSVEELGAFCKLEIECSRIDIRKKGADTTGDDGNSQAQPQPQ